MHRVDLHCRADLSDDTALSQVAMIGSVHVQQILPNDENGRAVVTLYGLDRLSMELYTDCV